MRQRNCVPRAAAQPAQLDSRRTLMTGVAIGVLIATGPLLALISKGALVTLIGIPLFWAIAAVIAISHSAANGVARPADRAQVRA